MSISAARAKLIDYPAAYHDNAGSFSFADGHVELHRWQSSILSITSYPLAAVGGKGSPSYEDWLWLAGHTTINTKTGTVP